MTSIPPSDKVAVCTVLALLDEALVQLTRVTDGAVLLEQASKELESAAGGCYRAMMSGTDHGASGVNIREAFEAAMRALQALQDVPSEDPAVDEALRLVAQAYGSMQRIGIGLGGAKNIRITGETGAVEQALLDEPRLIRTRRELVHPRVPLPRFDDVAIEVEVPEPAEAPTPITSLAELETAMRRSLDSLAAFDEPGEPEEPGPGGREPPREVPEDEALRLRFGVVVPIREQIVEQARECLLDLANMGRMRRPTAVESWCSGEETERRLLRRVDAIAACGESVFPDLVDMLADRPVPDPELTWALVFLFGSFDGDDACDQAWRIARTVDLEDTETVRDFVVALADAFALAPHPKIDEALVTWLASDIPGRREVAVRALTRRHSLRPAHLETALYDSDRMVRLAATRAVPVTEHASVTHLNRALMDPDEEFQRAAIWGFSKRVKRTGIRHAQDLVAQGRPGFAEAALLVAIAGGEDGREQLARAAVTDDSPALVRALGWLGDPQHVDALLGWLRDGDDALKGAALEALERITGASITKDEPEGARRDIPPFGEGFCEYEPEIELSDDPDLWTAWWHRYRSAVKRDRRYRFGHAFSLRDTMHEIEGEDFTNPQRERSYVELVVWSGGALPLDREDFVARQRRQLDQWRQYLHLRIDEPQHGWRTLVQDRVTLY
jgi:HEAT repeat protein